MFLFRKGIQKSDLLELLKIVAQASGLVVIDKMTIAEYDLLLEKVVNDFLKKYGGK